LICREKHLNSAYQGTIALFEYKSKLSLCHPRALH